MTVYQTNISDFSIRMAEKKDLRIILDFIFELAKYEKLLEEVVANEEILLESLFVKHQAEVIIGEYKGEAIGFALFFHNFSTFLGKANLYLEDLFVKEMFRGLGFGKAMFECLGKICEERDCSRLDWWCLDWNQSSINFYKKLGAKPMEDWTVYRITGEELKKLGDKK